MAALPGPVGGFVYVALWVGVFLAIGRLAWPLTRRLVPWADDAATAALSLPLGLAVVWLVSYWIGHLSLPIAAWVALLTLVALAALAAEGPLATPLLPRGGRPVVAVFVGAFVLLVLVRAFDPGIFGGGGEKFLDFGLLKSLLRTGGLPPEDMWFAGEPVSYYYGGHMLAAQLTRLTATPPAVAYNLALAGFFATLVATAYGLAAGIARAADVSARLGGALGAFFVGIASNLATPANLVLALLPTGIATDLGLFGRELRGLATGLAEFSYWTASRVIPGTINEFPLFAWLNGDLHAHMMSTPFLLLVAGFVFAYWRTPRAQVRRRRLLIFAAIPPVGGLLAVTNTWSFPSVGGLTALGVYFADAPPNSLLPRGLRRWVGGRTGPIGESARFLVAVGVGVLVLLVGMAWVAPFWLGTATGRSIGFLPDRSPLGPLLLVHGAFLLVFGGYLARHAIPRLPRPHLLGLGGLAVVVLAGQVGLAGVAILVGLGAAAWVLLRISGRRSEPDAGDRVADEASAADGGTRLPTPGFESVLLIAGLGLIVLVEFVYVQEQAGPGRMNTVFKTYAQVWVLLSVGAGAALARLVSRRDRSLGLAGPRWRTGLRVFAAVLVVATSLYAAFALFTHVGEPALAGDAMTLDGTAYVEDRHPGEAPAIRWLDARDGQPTIITKPGRQLYSWESAPPSLTGVPTVIGWVHHERGFGRATANRRATHVNTIYTGDPQRQRALLARYDVEYVYVGPEEREAYDEITVDDRQDLTVAMETGAVTIYEVE